MQADGKSKRTWKLLHFSLFFFSSSLGLMSVSVCSHCPFVAMERPVTPSPHCAVSSPSHTADSVVQPARTSRSCVSRGQRISIVQRNWSPINTIAVSKIYKKIKISVLLKRRSHPTPKKNMNSAWINLEIGTSALFYGTVSARITNPGPATSLCLSSTD